jgi:DUF1680 family protein
VDAVRGCLALERGPVVYCVEQADLPESAQVDDLVLDPTVAPCELGPGAGVDAVRLEVTCSVVAATDGLYAIAPVVPRRGEPLPVPAVPFATWGNRSPGAMRVWIPACRP